MAASDLPQRGSPRCHRHRGCTYQEGRRFLCSRRSNHLRSIGCPHPATRDAAASSQPVPGPPRDRKVMGRLAFASVPGVPGHRLVLLPAGPHIGTAAARRCCLLRRRARRFTALRIPGCPARAHRREVAQAGDARHVRDRSPAVPPHVGYRGSCGRSCLRAASATGPEPYPGIKWP